MIIENVFEILFVKSKYIVTKQSNIENKNSYCLKYAIIPSMYVRVSIIVYCVFENISALSKIIFYYSLLTYILQTLFLCKN